MRKTVTLAPDVAARIQQLAVEGGMTFTATLNATLRAGLEADAGSRRFYQEMTRSLGVQPGIVTKALRLATELEDEETLRTARFTSEDPPVVSAEARTRREFGSDRHVLSVPEDDFDAPLPGEALDESER